MGTTPTVVLVHGAFADASGFGGVIRILRGEGLEVRPPANPLRWLASDAEAITSYTTSLDGPIVLAGHSYGGNAIPPDAERFMAQRMNATTESVDGSHAAFIAHPEVAAAVTLKAVAAA